MAKMHKQVNVLKVSCSDSSGTNSVSFKHVVSNWVLLTNCCGGIPTSVQSLTVVWQQGQMFVWFADRSMPSPRHFHWLLRFSDAFHSCLAFWLNSFSLASTRSLASFLSAWLLSWTQLSLTLCQHVLVGFFLASSRNKLLLQGTCCSLATGPREVATLEYLAWLFRYLQDSANGSHDQAWFWNEVTDSLHGLMSVGE